MPERISSTQILARFAQQRMLVVGDIFLDEYIFGHATRLSREAPIPVLEFLRQTCLPGGAANPAHNIAALGAQAMLGAVIGDDTAGQQLLSLLHSTNVATNCVLTDPSRPTTVKTRIVSESSLRFSQQLARIDRIDRTPISVAMTTELLKKVVHCLPHVDALLCSDYLSGLLTPTLVEDLKQLCTERQILFTVDAQGELYKYTGADVLRCNNDEAAMYLGYPLKTEEDYHRALPDLLDRLQPRLLIVTRGREGLSLQGRDQPYQYIPAHCIEAADTTGAGDTFIALLTLALVAGLDTVMAAQVANYAAGLVVRRVGNAVVAPEELAEGLDYLLLGEPVPTP